MGETKSLLIVSALNGLVAIIKLLGSMFIIWLTLGWKVRKAKTAFEKELVKQGMSKKDARRISAQYAAVKDQVMNAFKRSIRFFP